MEASVEGSTEGAGIDDAREEGAAVGGIAGAGETVKGFPMCAA